MKSDKLWNVERAVAAGLPTLRLLRDLADQRITLQDAERRAAQIVTDHELKEPPPHTGDR